MDVLGESARTRIVETGEVDWSLSPELWEELRKRTAMVVRQYKGVVPFEDLFQEALIWAATHPVTVRTHLADVAKGTPYTGLAVQQHLAKCCKREHKRLSPLLSLDVLWHESPDRERTK